MRTNLLFERLRPALGGSDLQPIHSARARQFLRDVPVTLDTRERYFNLTYSARRDKHGDIDGVMVLGTEVTDIIETRHLQEQMVVALTSEREIRDHFVATLTHDVRTPLTAARKALRPSLQ